MWNRSRALAIVLFISTLAIAQERVEQRLKATITRILGTDFSIAEHDRVLFQLPATAADALRQNKIPDALREELDKTTLRFDEEATIHSLKNGEQWRIDGIQGGISLFVRPAAGQLEVSTRRLARHAVPFVQLFERPRVVVLHRLEAPGLKQPIEARSFFAADGEFLEAESVNAIDDPRRMGPEIVEKGMKRGSERFVGPASDHTQLDLNKFWKRIAERIPLSEIQEFHLAYVDLEDADGQVKQALVLCLWGPQNPLSMPEQLRLPGCTIEESLRLAGSTVCDLYSEDAACPTSSRLR